MSILTDKEAAGYKSLVENRFAGQQDTLKLIAHYEATIEVLKSQVPQKVELPKEVAERIDHYEEAGIEAFEYHLWTIIQNKNYGDALFDFLNKNTESLTKVLMAFRYGYTVKEEPTVEDKLRTSWTPKIEAIVRDYHGDASPQLTRKIIDGIMPLTREVLKAVEAEERE